MRRACAGPMRTARKGAICAGTRPTVTSGVPILALFSAITQSATARSPTPPPMAAPSTRAISALGSASANCSSAPNRRLEAAATSGPASPDAPRASMPLRSPPAQNVPLAPPSTTARTALSSRASVKTSVSSRTIVGDSALRASGRLSATFRTGPSRSTISVSCGMAGTPRPPTALPSPSCRRRVFDTTGGESWRRMSPPLTPQAGRGGMSTLPVPLPRQDAHVLADDRQHDLVGAAADGAETGVAVGAGDGALAHEAHAAPVLQAGVRDLARQPPRFQLGHRGQHGHVLALQHKLGRAIGQRAQHLHLGFQFGQAEMHDLVVEDRLAERLALAGVFNGVLDHALLGDEAGRCRIEPLLLELQHLIREALALLADAVTLRHAHVLEEDLRGVG